LSNYWAAAVNGTFTVSAKDRPGANEIDTDPPYFFACPAGQCTGQKDFGCVKGYTGVMCNECRVGQFQFKAACDLSCDDIEPAGAHGVVTIFGILAVMVVWVVLNKSAGGLFECLDVGLSFMQLLSTIFTFSEMYRGHSVYYWTIVDISNIINLNVDYVAPSCLLTDAVWRYTYGYYALLIVPLMPFLISLLLYLLARVWAAFIRQRVIFGTFHFGFMCANSDQANDYFVACIKQSVPFLGVVYNSKYLLY
jgi:hypothetical protein